MSTAVVNPTLDLQPQLRGLVQIMCVLVGMPKCSCGLDKILRPVVGAKQFPRRLECPTCGYSQELVDHRNRGIQKPHLELPYCEIDGGCSYKPQTGSVTEANGMQVLFVAENNKKSWQYESEESGYLHPDDQSPRGAALWNAEEKVKREQAKQAERDRRRLSLAESWEPPTPEEQPEIGCYLVRQAKPPETFYPTFNANYFWVPAEPSNVHFDEYQWGKYSHSTKSQRPAWVEPDVNEFEDLQRTFSEHGLAESLDDKPTTKGIPDEVEGEQTVSDSEDQILDYVPPADEEESSLERVEELKHLRAEVLRDLHRLQQLAFGQSYLEIGSVQGISKAQPKRFYEPPLEKCEHGCWLYFVHDGVRIDDGKELCSICTPRVLPYHFKVHRVPLESDSIVVDQWLEHSETVEFIVVNQWLVDFHVEECWRQVELVFTPEDRHYAGFYRSKRREHETITDWCLRAGHFDVQSELCEVWWLMASAKEVEKCNTHKSAAVSKAEWEVWVDRAEMILKADSDTHCWECGDVKLAGKGHYCQPCTEAMIWKPQPEVAGHTEMPLTEGQNASYQSKKVRPTGSDVIVPVTIEEVRWAATVWLLRCYRPKPRGVFSKLATRFYHFLQGETLESIGASENPQVGRKAIHAYLKKHAADIRLAVDLYRPFDYQSQMWIQTGLGLRRPMKGVLPIPLDDIGSLFHFDEPDTPED